MQTPLGDFIKKHLGEMPRKSIYDAKRVVAAHVFNPWKHDAYSTRRALGKIAKGAGLRLSTGDIMHTAIAIRQSYALVDWRIRVIQRLMRTRGALSISESSEYQFLRKDPPWRGMGRAVARDEVSVADMSSMLEEVIRNLSGRVKNLVFRDMRFLFVAHGISRDDLANELILSASTDLRWVYPYVDNPGGLFWSRIQKHAKKKIASMTSEKHSQILEADAAAGATPKHAPLSDTLVCSASPPDYSIMVPWNGRTVCEKTRKIAAAVATEDLPTKLLTKMNLVLPKSHRTDDPEELYKHLGPKIYYGMIRRHWGLPKKQFQSLITGLL